MANNEYDVYDVFRVGDKVKLAHPGHVCSRFDEAVIVALEAPAYPELCVIKFQNGMICNCSYDKLTVISSSSKVKKVVFLGNKT